MLYRDEVTEGSLIVPGVNYEDVHSASLMASGSVYRIEPVFDDRDDGGEERPLLGDYSIHKAPHARRYKPLRRPKKPSAIVQP